MLNAYNDAVTANIPMELRASKFMFMNGNVGIGTTNPCVADCATATRLHVFTSGGAGNNEVASFEGGIDTDNTYGVLRVTHANDRGFFVKGGRQIGNTAIATMGLVSNTGAMTDVMTFLTGYVGIGTTTPGVVTSGFTLSGLVSHVKSTTGLARGVFEGTTPGLYFSDYDGGVNDKNIGFSVDGGIAKWRSDTDLGGLRVDNILVMDLGTGNVGVGTATPDHKLDVSGNVSVSSSGDLIVQAGDIISPFGGLGKYENLLVRSEEIDNASWTREAFTGTITANATTGPNGEMTADQINSTAGYVYQSKTLSVSTTYTFSVWLKSASGSTQNKRIYIWIYNGVGGSSQRASTTCNITTEWKRCSVTYTTASDETTSALGLVHSADNPYNIYVWGAQLESESTPGVYAQTSATTVVAGDGLFVNSAGPHILSGGNVGIGDTSPAALLTVGSGDLFQVNSSGAIAAAQGITNTGAVTTSGGIINLNASSNFAINIGTGTSTGAISIGGNANTVAINSSVWDISAAGAITGAASYNGLVVTANTGVITTGTWNGSVISPAYGGTGVANNAAATVTSSGNFAYTRTLTGITNVTFPVSGTLYSTLNDPLDTISEWQALCTNCVDIINDTTGTLTVARGGTGATTLTANGVLYGNATGVVQATAQGAANTVLVANAGAPSFSAAITVGTSVTSPSLVATTAVTTPSIVTSAGALGITPAAGSNLNVNLSTTGDFAVNTNQLYVDTSAASVGIGTATPGYKLDVAGTFHATGVSTLDSNLVFTQGASTRNVGTVGTYSPNSLAAIWAMGTSYQLSATGTAGSLYGLSYSYEPDYGGVGNNPGAVAGLGHQMQWRAAGTTQTAIGTGIYTIGNVAVAGTTGLTLSGAGADINFTGTGPNQITTASGVNLALMPGGTGKVGIGTTTPATKLQITPDLNYGTPTLGTASGGFSMTSLNGLYGVYAGVDPSGSTWIQAMRNDSAVAYNLNLQPSGGNVGIGTTGPAAKLDVTQTAADYALITRYDNNSTSPFSGFPQLSVRNLDTTANNGMLMSFQTNNSAASLYSAVQIGVKNTSHTSTAENADIYFRQVTGDGTGVQNTMIMSGRKVSIGTDNTPTAQLDVNQSAVGNVGAKIKQIASATADSLQIQDSTGANTLRVTAAGDQEFSGNLNNGFGGLGRFQNLLTYSEQLDNGAWAATGITVTANSTAAPDGTTTGDTLTGTGASSLIQTYTTTTNGNYTFSFWAKTTSGTVTTGLRIDSTGATPTTGTATTYTATTTWQRFSVTQNFTGTPSNIKAVILPGNGSTGTIIAWGAQLVQDTVPEVYARTTASTVAANRGLVSNGGEFISAVDATDKPLIVQAAPSQSANLFEVQDSTGTAMTTVSSAGWLGIGLAPTQALDVLGNAKISQTTVSTSALFAVNGPGNPATFGTAGASFTASATSIVKLDSSHIVSGYVYNDGANDNVYVRVGTYVGDSISWASGLNITNNGGGLDPAGTVLHGQISIGVLDSTHVVVAWSSMSGGVITTKVCSISGTTPTCGASNAPASVSSNYTVSVAGLDSTHFVIVYNDTTNNRGQARVGVVSGTTISSYGTAVNYTATSTTASYNTVEALSSTKFVVSFNSGSPSAGKAIIGDVTAGTTITFGTAVTFNSLATAYNSIDAISTTGFIVAFQDTGNTSLGAAIAATYSGNTITFGSKYYFSSETTTYTAVSMLDSTNFAISYQGTSTGYSVTGAISSSTVLSFGTKATFSASATTYISSTALTSTTFANVYQSSTGSIIGTFTTDTTLNKAFNIINNGNVAVGTSASSSYKLIVQDSQSATYVARINNTSTANTADGLLISLAVANASRSTGNYFIGFATADGTVAGKIQGGASAVAYTTTGADLAEWFLDADANSKPQDSEIVAFDVGSSKTVKKAISSVAPIVGVVSNNAGFIGNGPICKVDDSNCDSNYGSYNTLVGLIGQLSVKVNLDGGDIKPGDYITVSSVAGVGKKATSSGYVVGIAMEGYGTEQATAIAEKNSTLDAEGNPVTQDPKTVISTIRVLIRPEFYTAPAQFVFDENGNVGFGTEKPSAAFEIASGLNAVKTLSDGTTETATSLTAVLINPVFNDMGAENVKHYGLVVTNGNIGFGTSAPETRVHISDDSNAEAVGLTIQSTADFAEGFAADIFRVIAKVGGVSKTQLRVTTEGNIFAVGSITIGGQFITTGASTFTQEFIISDDASAGDVVSIAGANISKATKPYDPSIFGVIVQKGGFVLGMPRDGATQATVGGIKEVAYMGTELVNITDENGSISRGDFLTASSSIPGYAMRATVSGRVIGQALNDISALDNSQVVNGLTIHTGKVLVSLRTAFEQINNTFVLGNDDIAALTAQQIASGDGSTTQGSTDVSGTIASSNSSLTFVIRQAVSTSVSSADGTTTSTSVNADILQVQSGKVNRFMIASNGAVNINTSIALDSGKNIFAVRNNGVDQFIIRAKGGAVLGASLIVKKDLIALGQVLGSTAILAKNTGDTDIQQGDVVVLRGVESETIVGNNTILSVSKADTTLSAETNGVAEVTSPTGDSQVINATIVVGVADRNMSDFDIPGAPVSQATSTTIIPKGEFMNVVTSGTFGMINVEAGEGLTQNSILPGDKLTISDVSGHARKLKPNESGMPVIGIALDSLVSGAGKVRVLLMINNTYVSGTPTNTTTQSATSGGSQTTTNTSAGTDSGTTTPAPTTDTTATGQGTTAVDSTSTTTDQTTTVAPTDTTTTDQTSTSVTPTDTTTTADQTITVTEPAPTAVPTVTDSPTTVDTSGTVATSDASTTTP
ncbi:MAG: beta strand repeat-containing protein [Candidatus Doudnabacteria bacterium]